MPVGQAGEKERRLIDMLAYIIILSVLVDRGTSIGMIILCMAGILWSGIKWAVFLGMMGQKVIGRGGHNETD